MNRHGNPRFYKLLEEMADLHDKKSHDYASDENPSGNYHFAGSLAKLFDNPDDAGFIGRIGEKLYRLANLENSGKKPSNETVEDTERDIAVITCLWMADRQDRRTKPNPLETELFDLIKLMPDSQTEKITDFIRDMRQIRSRNISVSGVREVGKEPWEDARMSKDGMSVMGATSGMTFASQPAAPDYDSILRTMLQLNDSILNYLKR